jgi:hypothetical protein
MAIMGDERNRTLGDAWQHAIGNVIAVLVFLFSFCWLYRHGAAGVLPNGADPVVDRHRHYPVHRLEVRRNGLSPRRCCLCRAAGAKPTL